MRFYKATSPDGTDFRTGRVRYEVGATVRPLPHKGRPLLCGPGVLHAATVPTETLVGGWWPCRLFEVEGDPVAGLNDKHPYKAGFAELTVVRELPAHLVFGPQGREVVALIDRARRLTRDEIEALAAARGAAASAAARDAARAAGCAAAWGGAARGGAWDGAWDGAQVAAQVAAWDANAARDATRDAALHAAADAAAALVVRDVLPAEHFDCLYGPWRDVIGLEFGGAAEEASDQ